MISMSETKISLKSVSNTDHTFCASCLCVQSYKSEVRSSMPGIKHYEFQSTLIALISFVSQPLLTTDGLYDSLPVVIEHLHAPVDGGLESSTHCN